MKPMRPVGPKKGYRVFDGQVFTLGFFRTRGIKKQELPEAQAKLQAQAIRELGVNARVVKGKGWAAVYVAEKKKRSKQPKPYKPQVTKSTGFETRREWKVNVDGRNLPLTQGKAKVLESWKWDVMEPVTKEQGIVNRKNELKKGMSVRFWEDNDYFEKEGLGQLKTSESSSQIHGGDFKDDSQITNIEVINLQSPEGIEFYQNLTGGGSQKNHLQESFKNWLNNVGKRREKKWKNNPLLEDYYDFFINGTRKDLDIFVISIDNQRAFWSPSQGDFAKRMTKATEEFKGWNRFTSDGRGKRA